MLDEYTARNNAALVELKETHRVDIRALPKEVLAALRTISAESVWRLAQHDDLSRRIFDSFENFSTNVIEYHKISEQAYLAARDDT